MLKIRHAILHVFDFDSGSSYLSDCELDTSERPTRSYVQRHLRKVSTSPESRHGAFSEGSAFAQKISDYAAGREEFVALSQEVGLYFWEELRRSDDPGQCDVLIVDFEDTDARTSQAKTAISLAGKTAAFCNHSYIGTEHLLIGIFAAATPAIKRIFADHGITRAAFTAELAKVKTSLKIMVTTNMASIYSIYLTMHQSLLQRFLQQQKRQRQSECQQLLQ